MMPRWRVDLIRKVLATLGTVEAPDEKSAIAEAAREFKNHARSAQQDHRQEDRSGAQSLVQNAGPRAAVRSEALRGKT
jgi:hypothetical protein